jgi:hypothetical protein
MSEQPLTQVSEFDHPSEGYIVIAPLSEQSKQWIATIQARFTERFGEENLWLPTEEQLHITFAHIITPSVEYSEDRSTLFDRVRPLASAALQKILAHPFSVKSRFDTIEAFPSAVILRASDDGSFEKLRKEFVDTFSLPKGTRTPPEIIHTTLLRFRNPVDLAEVQKLTLEIRNELEPIDEETTSLQLIREKKIFVQEHEVLEEYPPNITHPASH